MTAVHNFHRMTPGNQRQKGAGDGVGFYLVFHANYGIAALFGGGNLFQWKSGLPGGFFCIFSLLGWIGGGGSDDEIGYISRFFSPVPKNLCFFWEKFKKS